MGVFSATASALRKSLTRTREAMGRPLRRLLAGRELSNALVSEIETALITADVGVGCTGAIIDELQQARREGQFVDAGEALPFLKTRLKARLQPASVELALTEGGLSVILVALGGFLRFCPEGAVAFHRAAIAEGRRYMPMAPTDDVIDAEWRRD